MPDITIANLFEQAAGRIRADFEYVRSTNPHPGEKGQEAEAVVREFLNAHLPKRFRADPGIVIDFENSLSRQTDLIVYDALSSPLYRAAERMNIIPAHNVAAVVEVKSNITKRELEDAYAKIASVKALQRLPLTNTDQVSTTSGASTSAALGIVFAFDSDTSLESLAENMKEFNTRYASTLWPDLLMVLDKGVVTYAMQWPGQGEMAGALLSLSAPSSRTIGPPPWYVQLVVHHDGVRALNRLFLMMLMHLTFYPLRSGIPPFNTMLGADTHLALAIQGYQYDLGALLREVPVELHDDRQPKVKLQIEISSTEGKPLATLQFIPWQDGACVRKFGVLPLERLLPLVSTRPDLLALDQKLPNGSQISTVFALTEADFRAWPAVLETKSNIKARLVDKSLNKDE